jgi:hypothetical protein
LCVVRLLDGVRSAAARDRRYWVHLLWIFTKLLNCSIYWWGLWSSHATATWNFASFIWVLLFPGILYLQCTALVTTTPNEIRHWREHFFGIRRWFFGINLLLIGHSLLSTWVIFEVPVMDVSRLPLVVVFVLNVIGLFSANPRLHATLVVIALLTNLVGFGSVWFQPDPVTAG